MFAAIVNVEKLDLRRAGSFWWLLHGDTLLLVAQDWLSCPHLSLLRASDSLAMYRTLSVFRRRVMVPWGAKSIEPLPPVYSG